MLCWSQGNDDDKRVGGEEVSDCMQDSDDSSCGGTWAALQIQDRSPKSRLVASLNQSQTQLTRPVATGLGLQRDPDGRKANWSVNEREGDELRNAGYMYSLMTIRSMIRVRTGVIDMCRKSECVLGAAVLLIGRIEACFHCRGTKDVVRDRLNKSASEP